MVEGWGRGGGHGQSDGAYDKDPGGSQNVLSLLAESLKNAVIAWVKCGFPSSSGSDERQAQGVRLKLDTGS